MSNKYCNKEYMVRKPCTCHFAINALQTQYDTLKTENKRLLSNFLDSKFAQNLMAIEKERDALIAKLHEEKEKWSKEIIRITEELNYDRDLWRGIAEKLADAIRFYRGCSQEDFDSVEDISEALARYNEAVKK